MPYIFISNIFLFRLKLFIIVIFYTFFLYIITALIPLFSNLDLSYLSLKMLFSTLALNNTLFLSLIMSFLGI